MNDLQGRVKNDSTGKKLLAHYDSLKSVYGDSLTYVSDIYINEIDSSGQMEEEIIDIINQLKEVKEKAEYIQKQTKGQRHLQYTIWQKPTRDRRYYCVKVMEGNGGSYHTHFNFCVRVKPFQILYYDTVSDTTLDLNTWRKSKTQ